MYTPCTVVLVPFCAMNWKSRLRSGINGVSVLRSLRCTCHRHRTKKYSYPVQVIAWFPLPFTCMCTVHMFVHFPQEAYGWLHLKKTYICSPRTTFMLVQKRILNPINLILSRQLDVEICCEDDFGLTSASTGSFGRLSWFRWLTWTHEPTSK